MNFRDRFYQCSGIGRKRSIEMGNLWVSCLKDSILEDGEVKIRGFGVFRVFDRKVNNKSSYRKRICFRPSSKLKRLLREENENGKLKSGK